MNARPRSHPRWRLTAAALATGLGLGLGAAGPLGGMAPAHAQAAPGWHILVYAVNDSGSDLPLGYDLDEMVAASRSGTSFTVYADSSDIGDYPASQFVANSAQAVIIEVAGGAATVTDQLGELDSGSPDTLAWFIATALTRHPADRSALVLWDHGGGWRGIAFDENVTADGAATISSTIDAAELGRAMDVGLDGAGRARFDLLILDACLMANIDVVSETSGSASYLVASEELVSGLGLNYEAFDVFATDPGADAVTLFDALATGFRQDIEREAPGDTDMITLSLTDLGHAPALDQAVAAFAEAAVADVAVNTGTYVAAAAAGLRYGVSGGDWFGYLDLGEYLGRLTDIGPVAAAARDDLLATLDAAVVSKIDSPSYASSTGLTMYLPEPHEYDPRYERQPTAQLWRPFLDALYDAQAAVVLVADVGFTAASLAAQPRPEGGYAIDAPLTANFTGSVQMLAALPNGAGNLTFFQTTSGDVADGRATAALLPELATISDGTASAVPYTSFMFQGGVAHAYSQFLLQRADGSTANLNWDRAADAAAGPFTVIDPNGTVVGYTPQAGDRAFPIVLVQRPGAAPAREATGPALDLNAAWSVSNVPLATGQQVFVELQLVDQAGAVVDALNGYVTIGA